jgi:hypothetical protein
VSPVPTQAACPAAPFNGSPGESFLGFHAVFEQNCSCLLTRALELIATTEIVSMDCRSDLFQQTELRLKL